MIVAIIITGNEWTDNETNYIDVCDSDSDEMMMSVWV